MAPYPTGSVRRLQLVDRLPIATAIRPSARLNRKNVDKPFSMTPSIAHLTLVLIGSFAPDEFLPAKLYERSALSKTDRTGAEFVALVPGQIVHFNLA